MNRVGQIRVYGKRTTAPKLIIPTTPFIPHESALPSASAATGPPASPCSDARRGDQRWEGFVRLVTGWLA